MLIVDYPTKKAMKECVGQRLKYRETSVVGNEYESDGEIFVCNRPWITGHKREFYAKVTMKGGRIEKVE